MNNWIRAKHETIYRFKVEAHALVRKGEKLHIANKKAEKKVKGDVELRAFLTYCATNDFTLDNWLRAKEECYNRTDFYKNVNKSAKRLMEKSVIKITPKAAFLWSKLEFINSRAYFIWKSRCDMQSNWYDAESSLLNEINEGAKKILEKNEYLSLEEAWYFSRDLYYGKIRERARDKWKWVSQRAYYISLENPSNSEYDNWCLAAKEYDSRLSWISERAHNMSLENPSNSEDDNWCLAAKEYDSRR